MRSVIRVVQGDPSPTETATVDDERNSCPVNVTIPSPPIGMPPASSTTAPAFASSAPSPPVAEASPPIVEKKKKKKKVIHYGWVSKQLYCAMVLEFNPEAYDFVRTRIGGRPRIGARRRHLVTRAVLCLHRTQDCPTRWQALLEQSTFGMCPRAYTILHLVVQPLNLRTKVTASPQARSLCHLHLHRQTAVIQKTHVLESA